MFELGSKVEKSENAGSVVSKVTSSVAFFLFLFFFERVMSPPHSYIYRPCPTSPDKANADLRI